MTTSQKQRILVVDDDRQIARLVREYLEKAGYFVLVAYDGGNGRLTATSPGINQGSSFTIHLSM